MKLEHRKEVEAAVEAAREASRKMEKYLRDGFRVEGTKSRKADIVTDADKACQEAIVSSLRSKFPESGFRAEEEDLSPSGEEKIWVIDPIDGTLNFSKGFPYFCCSIALKQNKEYVAGAVMSPPSALGEYYFASKDSGAYRGEIEQKIDEASSIEVSDQEIEGARISFDYSERDSKARQFGSGEAQSLVESGAAISRPGAAALNLCMLARGSLDGMIAHVNEWDFAAGGLILEEAGGRFESRYMDSNGLYEVLASNGRTHGELLNIARTEG